MKKCKYQILEELGHGSFGKIYKVVNKTNNKEYALKIETPNSKNVKGQLQQEYIVYKTLDSVKINDNTLWPKIYDYGYNSKKDNVLIMDVYGENLEEKFKNNVFNTYTIAYIAKKMLNLLEKFHSFNFIHRDLKPQNFVVGKDSNNKHEIYLIDYGITKLKNDNIEFDKSLKGTVRYSSINTHLGCEQSFRDDLCSLVYIILFFTLKRLPWQDCIKKFPKKKKLELYDQVLYEKMKQSPIDMTNLIPPEHEKLKTPLLILQMYANSLDFDGKPNYKYLQSLFDEIGKDTLNFQ